GPGVAYFDGTNWHTPELIADILKLTQSGIAQPTIMTSGGAVFVLAVSADYNNTYYSIKASASSAWNTPQSVSGDHINGWDDMFDDNNPVLNFLTNERVSNFNYLYRLALTGPNAGTAVVEPGAFPEVSFLTSPMVTADGSRLFVVYDSDTRQAEGHRMFSFKDFSTQNNWQLVPNFPSSLRTSTASGGTADIENNGLICEAIEIAMGVNQTFACLDTTQPGSYWMPFPAITYNSNDWQLLTRADGAWINFNAVVENDNIETLIYSYDKKTESVINTQFPSRPFDLSQDTQVTQVGASGLLACHGLIVVQPHPQPIKLYYYDNQNNLGWQRIKVGNTALTSCGFSVAGTPGHNLHRVSSGGTLWLFDNAPNPGTKNFSPRA
ncbi:MAG: hypothetical protein K5Q00_08300, partial [Gammaproteobacteria bacterium]|nr:hypothetical protein [Gammaproteobacteria bacterium]